MRASSVLEHSDDKLLFREIKDGPKHKGVVTRVEKYGVFVQLENSNLRGLRQRLECSEKLVEDGTVGNL